MGLTQVQPDMLSPGNPASNSLLNAAFDLWQRGTSITGIANGSSTYGPDRWYAKNSLGTNGVLRIDQTTGGVDGSKYGCSVKISTAPTAAQANGCELYQTLENFNTLPFYNKTASFSIWAKALGNVTQVGVQFFYKTTEAKVDTSIGSEQLLTVTTGGFALAKIASQALGNSMTTSGVIGVRIRITGVSSGNTYDINYEFVVEQAMMSLGPLAPFSRAGANIGDELMMCSRYYIASQTGIGSEAYNTGPAAREIWHFEKFPTVMRGTPSVVIGGTVASSNAGSTAVTQTSGYGFLFELDRNTSALYWIVVNYTSDAEI